MRLVVNCPATESGIGLVRQKREDRVDHYTTESDAMHEPEGVREVLQELDRTPIGMEPVKLRIRETMALLPVDQARRRIAWATETPTLHMSCTGNPGTGKTTVVLRMADLLHWLSDVLMGHRVCVTRDDLVGQYIGHIAPNTKEV